VRLIGTSNEPDGLLHEGKGRRGFLSASAVGRPKTQDAPGRPHGERVISRLGCTK